MKKRLLSVCLLLVMLVSLFMIPAQAAAASGAVTTAALNFRKDASTTAGIILTMPKGTNVLVLSTSNGWSKIVYNDTIGYASSDYLSAKSVVSGKFGTGTVTGSDVRMRSGANTSSSILFTCDKGTQMTVTGANGSWYAVSYKNKTGYVSGDYMTVSAGSAASTSTPAPSPTPTPTSTPTADGKFTGAIIGTSVRMRSQANTSSAILGTYSNGVKMSVLGSVKGWYHVSYNGKTGYVSADYFRITPTESYSSAKSGTVNGSGVNMRMGPSTDFAVVGSYSKGTELKITGVCGNWYEVSVNGKYGFMSKDYVKVGSSTSPTSTPAAEEPMDAVGTVTGSTVRLRSGPGTNYAVVGYCSKGTQIKITGKTGTWYAATYNGVKGYISSSYVKIGSVNSQAEQIVATAKEYLGVPYVWGGTSPKGFDCSGLVYYVYQQYGYGLQRRASLQYAYNGISVSRSNLQPADLLFFSDSTGEVGHAGMYIGNGQFIHASSGKGCVTINNLSDSYYNQHYIGAKRILK